ncbi:unnamed protein product, partial [Didymodactylos carnosus]
YNKDYFEMKKIYTTPVISQSNSEQHYVKIAAANNRRTTSNDKSSLDIKLIKPIKGSTKIQNGQRYEYVGNKWRTLCQDHTCHSRALKNSYCNKHREQQLTSSNDKIQKKIIKKRAGARKDNRNKKVHFQTPTNTVQHPPSSYEQVEDIKIKVEQASQTDVSYPPLGDYSNNVQNIYKEPCQISTNEDIPIAVKKEMMDNDYSVFSPMTFSSYTTSTETSTLSTAQICPQLQTCSTIQDLIHYQEMNDKEFRTKCHSIDRHLTLIDLLTH